MNNKKKLFINLLTFSLVLFTSACSSPSQKSPYDVIWDSPSENSFGSMPLGNGDIGLNIWGEKNGDILFYISKVDAFDAGHLLPKLGRIRIKTEPALSSDPFKQILNLNDASVTIQSGDTEFKIWVDANNPVIKVEGKSKTPRLIRIGLESLRPLMNEDLPLPSEGSAGIIFNVNEQQIAWFYRNQSSNWAINFSKQNTPELVACTKDPILHRTSGCLIQANGFEKESSTLLKSKEKTTSIDCSIKVLSSQPEDLKEWLSEVTKPLHSDWKAHCDYWKSFWDKSYIHISSCGKGNFNMDQCRYTQFAQGSRAYEGHKEIDSDKNAFQISQRYALERFCEAAASRGAVPPPYNGSIFTMDMPEGVMGFDVPKKHAISPDGRDWAELSFMWQNTRHPYWSMAARGDYDAIRPGMQFVRDGLEICKDHCKKYFGHEGAFIMEASWWYNVGVFGMENMPHHLRYHQLASIELPSIMCEYYEHTGEKDFLENVLLPCADEFIKFYKLHFPKRDINGKMLMEGVGCAETFQGVTNPCTEIGCLKYLLTKLLSFDLDDKHRKEWEELLFSMPEVPTRRIRGLDLLAVGDVYEPGRTNCESPELYSIYPFRQIWLGKPELLQNARQSFFLRTISLDGTVDAQGVETGGWQSAPVQAAYLGLAREAARLATINFNDQFIHWTDNVDPDAPYPNRPRARFPAFWECKMDGTPDNDHGANSVNCLQSMLLQGDGSKIFLLPAWPEEWDVSFKLCAPFNTTVECIYKDGKVQSLHVSPESRRKDIVDFSTPEQRIRNLVQIALADRNYLFGLPPMQDAQPTPGITTASWLSKYGYTLEGCKAGPWMNSVFKGKTVYVHITDWLQEGILLPSIPRNLVSSKSITGNIQIQKNEDGWLLTGTPDPLNTIVKLEFDSSVEEIAYSLPSKGSLNIGNKCLIQNMEDGFISATVQLQEEKNMERFEFTIDNPNHLRGNGKDFEIQIKKGGKWTTVYKGKVFGSICAKKFEPVKSKDVRLIVQAKEIKQFDVF